jgi:ferric-dicitrate binding protein FerR (iron transport regulator)
VTDRDCDRWIAIADAAAVGEPVSAAERQFEREHRAVCPQCRSEASLWSSLRPSRLQAVPREEDVDEIVRLFASKAPVEPSTTASWSPRAVAFAFAVGAALLTAAASFVLWGEMDGGNGGPSRLPSSAAPPATLAFSTGHYAADTCGDAGAGITLCVSAGSYITKLELSTPQHRVSLARGHALASVVSPLSGESLSIVTEQGQVTTAGAQFSVEVGPEGKTRVRVHRGKVTSRAAGSKTETLLAEGQSAHLGAANVGPVSEQDRARDFRLLSSTIAHVP